jgi:hypothetical protein
MKIDTIITSVNDSHDYTSFVKPICNAWTSLGVNVRLNVIGDEQFSFPGGGVTVINRKPIDGVRSSSQAQLSRIADAAAPENNSKIIMIADIDMIPLNDTQLRVYDDVLDTYLCKFGYDHPAFQNAPDIGKWPMHGTASSGKVFNRFVNPKDLSYEELIEEWCETEFSDPRSQPRQSGYFCDESLVKMLLDKNPQSSVLIARGLVGGGKFKQHPDGGYTVYGRICRAKHSSLEDINLDDYFEIHGPRPFIESWYKPVTKYLGETDERI